MKPEDVKIGMRFNHVDFAGSWLIVENIDGEEALCHSFSCFADSRDKIKLTQLVNEEQWRLMMIGMQDLEDITAFFMHMPIDQPVSKRILVNVLCRLNGVHDGDSRIIEEVKAWFVKTREKLSSLGRDLPR